MDKQPQRGDKVVVQTGEFRGTVLMVGRAYPDLVELQRLDPASGQWQDFCSVTPEELRRDTRPL